MKQIECTSSSEQETMDLGRVIGENVVAGQIILLEGELGSGKTIVVKGIARGLEILEQITSPTYILINEYQGRLPLCHMDFYRLEDNEELRQIGFEDYLDGNSVLAVEWPQLARELVLEDFLEIKIERQYSSKKETNNCHREITLQARGSKSRELLQNIVHRAPFCD